MPASRVGSPAPSRRAGERTPDGLQRLLSTADWDPDLVRG